MFEPATHGLLAYSLTDCATRVIKLSTNKNYQRKVIIIISLGSTSRNGGVPFPLKEVCYSSFYYPLFKCYF